MKVTILSLLVLFSLSMFSCEKDKEQKICKMDECSLCSEHKFEHGQKDVIFDELGNKFFTDRFNEDAQGKFYTDDQGNQLYCGKDVDGAYYTDTNNNKVYFKMGPWGDKKVEKYILSPLVKDNDCGYIVSGKIKFVVEGKTAAIVDYGDGEIDGWAVKTIYHRKGGHKGKGMGKGCGKEREYTKCCKFEQKCVQETATSTVNIETETTY